MNTPINILLVEDNPGDALLVEEYLSNNTEFEGKITHVRTLSESVDLLKTNSFDVVLLDLFLPDSKGFVTCMTLLDQFPSLLIIVLTGFEDKELGRWAAKMGAQDFLFKNDLSPNSLVKSIVYALERNKLKNEIREYTYDLEQSKTQMTALTHPSIMGTWEINLLDQKMKWSDELFQVFPAFKKGFPPSFGKFLELFEANDRLHISHAIRGITNNDKEFNLNLFSADHQIQFAMRGGLKPGSNSICRGTIKVLVESQAEKMN